jgi:molybdopterin-guanine dinucleotide biosynthesis protein A
MSGRFASRESVAIILAGGPGARLGIGAPKAWAPAPGGVSLLGRALATARSVTPRVVVAAPAGLELPPLDPPAAGAPARPAERIDDLGGGGGPLAGLVPALEWAARQGMARAWIIAVDMPALTAGDLECLGARLEREPRAVAVVPRSPAGLEPLCSCVRPAAAAAAFRAAYDRGERSVQRVFAGLGPGRLVELDATDPAQWSGGADRLRSVNTPEDLARAFPAEPLERPPGTP